MDAEPDRMAISRRTLLGCSGFAGAAGFLAAKTQSPFVTRIFRRDDQLSLWLERVWELQVHYAESASKTGAVSRLLGFVR